MVLVCRLTIHSSRTRFAGRLNSGVRAQMKISTLETSVAVPFEFGSAVRLVDSCPPEVQRHVAQGKPWHLTAWIDETQGVAGFCHKGHCVAFPWPAARAAIGSLRPAKGYGYVALEASPYQGPSVMVFCSSKYSEPLLQWLTANRDSVSAICGCQAEIEDWGSDY